MPAIIDTINKDEIIRAYLIKIGNIFIKLKTKENKNVKDLIKLATGELNKSKIVKKVETISSTRYPDYMMHERMKIPDEEISLKFSPFLKININIATKDQESVLRYKAMSREDYIDYAESYDILYNGSIFLISREADINKPLHPGAPDIREELINIFNESDAFSVEFMPPNPLREDMYLIFIRNNDENKKFIGKIDCKNDIIYLYASENDIKDINGHILSIYESIEHVINVFYHSIMSIKNLIKLTDEILDNNEEILNDINNLRNTSIFNILKRLNINKEIDNKLLKYHKQYITYQKLKMRCDMEKSRNKEIIEKTELLHCWKNKLFNELDRRLYDISTLENCVSYYKEATQFSNVFKMTIFGLFLGFLSSLILLTVQYFLKI